MIAILFSHLLFGALLTFFLFIYLEVEIPQLILEFKNGILSFLNIFKV